MEQVSIIVSQILVLTMLGLTGFVAGRRKMLPESAGYVLSRIIVKITLPALIFTTMLNYNFTHKDLISGLYIMLAAFCFIALASVVAWGAVRVMHVPSPTANIYRMSSIFGNVIFLAFPLLNSIYHEQGIIFAIFFSLVNDSIMWTFGVYLANKHRHHKWKDNISHMINGNTIAFSTGLAGVLLGFQRWIHAHPLLTSGWNFFYDTFHSLGQTTIYLSMIFIGLILSEIRIGSVRELLSRYPVFVLSGIKLMLLPVAAALILTPLIPLIGETVRNIVVLQIGMPCGTIVAALAAQYDSDYRFASECVLISTLLGVVTLPALVALLQLL